MKLNPKILVFAHEQNLNGASHSLLAIIKGLKSKYEFMVIVPENGMMTDELNKIGIEYQIINLPRCAYFKRVSAYDHFMKTIHFYNRKKKYEKELFLFTTKFDPDIIYTNTSVISFGYSLSKKIKKPHVWHIREYGDKYFDIQYLPSKYNIIKKIKKSYISIFTTRLLKKKWFGDKNLNFKVVYNGITIKNKLDHRRRVKKEFTIGVVGSIIESKNQKLALKIFKECYADNKNLRLNFYGTCSKDYYDKLNKYSKDNNLNKVVNFLGYVSNDVIYEAIDVLLSCSNNEGFGRTLIEAMSNMIPVISKNMGGPKEILKGLEKYSVFDNKEEAIIKLKKLVDDEDFYQKSSKEGYKIVKKIYSLESYLKNMDSIFRNVKVATQKQTS